MPKKRVTGSKSFGAFSGVFVPTFLSIIGVILYLRLGRIVGSTGLAGSLLIVVLAVSVTLSTGLSLSSITSNIRIGAGGAYSIVTRTLGLEVGASVGIPLFLAQVFSVVLYVFGFSEVWVFLFPSHNFLFVSLLTFLALLGINLISTRFAIRVQILVFGVVLLSLVSIFAGGSWAQGDLQVPVFNADAQFPFWAMFALFFPAVTGLMAGIGLSGELTDPKRQIPRGVISALSVTTAVYVLLIFYLAYSASAGALIEDTLLLTKLAALSSVVLAGMLAATFSSALTTIVAAPRLLQALGSHRVIPFSEFFSQKTRSGEPRNALLFTCVLCVTTLFLGSLDSVAPLLTMFFLISYSMINIAVYIEQTLGLVSFRPTFRVPRLVPLYGAAASTAFMFLINAFAGILAIGFLFAMLLVLSRSRFEQKHGDVRSGLLITFAEWAAKKVLRLPESSKHNWKPNVLLPVISSGTLFGSFPLVRSMVYPNGTMTVLGMHLVRDVKNPEEVKLDRREHRKELRDLKRLVEKFGEEGIFTSYSTVNTKDYTDGISISLEAVKGQIFHPNILFLPFRPDQLPERSLRRIFTTAKKSNVGVVLFDKDEDIGLGSEEDIHIWINPSSVRKEFFEDRNFDLSLLLSYRLFINWGGNLNIWMCGLKGKAQERAKTYLQRLLYEARFPPNTNVHVERASFRSCLRAAPSGDLHILPIQPRDLNRIKVLKKEKKSFLFVVDSGVEDVLA